MIHLELARTEDRTFPEIESPETVMSARIWHCKYRSLEPISRLVNLTELIVATWPDATLEPLSSLRKLEYLGILHLPKVSDLSPLAGLVNLRKLSLETLPSWDASGKVTRVSSLEPLAQLPLLEELTLFGVVPEPRSVDALLMSPSLRKVEVSKYPKVERQKIEERFGR